MGGVEARQSLVGRIARVAAMQRLLRYAGARFMAAGDLDTGLHLVRRFAIELVIADIDEDERDLAPFQRAGVVIVRLASSCDGLGEAPQRAA